MRKLILVKHSLPEIVPDVPAREWLLSEEGRRRCEPLAKQLACYAPEMVIASREPKAAETGRIVAERLKLAFAQADNLHEHCRENEPFGTREEFHACIQRFFGCPADLVYGDETADAAYQRFYRATHDMMQNHADKNVVIVAHGTVITLFVSRHLKIEPFPFWEQLGLPSIVVLTWPKIELLQLISEVK